MWLTIQSPLHVAQIDGHRLRFFSSPSPRPDLPWCSATDLAGAAGYDAEGGLKFCRYLWAGPHRARIARIATPEGPVVIAPNWLAASFFDSVAAPEIVPQYNQALMSAVAKLFPAMASAARRERWAEMAKRDYEAAPHDNLATT